MMNGRFTKGTGVALGVLTATALSISPASAAGGDGHKHKVVSRLFGSDTMKAKAMFAERQSSVQGTHGHTENVFNSPQPVRPGGPPAPTPPEPSSSSATARSWANPWD